MEVKLPSFSFNYQCKKIESTNNNKQRRSILCSNNQEKKSANKTNNVRIFCCQNNNSHHSGPIEWMEEDHSKRTILHIGTIWSLFDFFVSNNFNLIFIFYPPLFFHYSSFHIFSMSSQIFFVCELTQWSAPTISFSPSLDIARFSCPNV